MTKGGVEGDTTEQRAWPWATAAAIGVAVLSVVYAVAYLIVAPSDQRGTDAGAFFTSYVDQPAGLRIASLCLLVSGVLTTVVYAALHRVSTHSYLARTWAFAVGAVAGIATAAHGLNDLLAVDKLAHEYVDGDSARRAAVVVAHELPSQVDPRGLATFGLVGLVIIAFSSAMMSNSRKLGALGIVLGIDMVLLFLSSALALKIPILVTGGLASLILGPIWWIGVGVYLHSHKPVTTR